MMNGGVVPGGICAHRGLRDRRDLRGRRLDVRAGLEEDLDDRDAGERLALDVLDVVDGRGEAALVVGDDALLHLLGRQAGVVPDDRDDRDVDVREDVGRHPRRSCTPPRMTMSIDITTNVYGRRSARRTIHIAAPSVPGGPRGLATAIARAVTVAVRRGFGSALSPRRSCDDDRRTRSAALGRDDQRDAPGLWYRRALVGRIGFATRALIACVAVAPAPSTGDRIAGASARSAAIRTRRIAW